MRKQVRKLWRDVQKHPPLVVGCVGGSGSRVVAEILHRTGCHMGRNLNYAMDNMDFAFCLGGRLGWLRRTFPIDADNPEAARAIALFEKLYFRRWLSFAERCRLLRIGSEYLRSSSLKLVRTEPLRRRLRHLIAVLCGGLDNGPAGAEPLKRWGFKLPGSIILLEPLLNAYPDMQFIQVVRDGRDMALSPNRKMATHYASLFGIEDGYTPERAFELWCRMNKSADEVCTRRMKKDNHLIVHFEALCCNPREETDRILRFARLPSPADPSVYSIPRKIESIGRWRSRPDLFAEVDTDALERFGYDHSAKAEEAR